MKVTRVCPEENLGEEPYKGTAPTKSLSRSSTMPPTSPQVTQEIFNALLFTPFHENVTIYPDDVFVASPRRENFQSPMNDTTPVVTYVSVLNAERPLVNAPTSTTTQGSFPLPNHATAAIAAILSYYLPHDIDARLHNHQWFLMLQLFPPFDLPDAYR